MTKLYKQVKAVRASDTTMVYVTKERPHFYSTFAVNERDGFVCFCKEFDNAGDAIAYANRVVAKLSK